MPHALITLAIIEIVAFASCIWSQVLAKFKALGCASQNVVEVTLGVESTDDMVLRGHVEFLHDTVEFLSELDILCIKSCDLDVFLRK